MLSRVCLADYLPGLGVCVCECCLSYLPWLLGKPQRDAGDRLGDESPDALVDLASPLCVALRTPKKTMAERDVWMLRDWRMCVCVWLQRGHHVAWIVTHTQACLTRVV